MKIGIVIVTYNIDTRIFILQVESIKRFCKDKDYTIQIIDNSSDEAKAESIRYYSNVHNVYHRRTNSGNADASRSHAFAANLSYQILKEQYNGFFYLDHDCIPVKDFSVEEILGDKIIAGVRSGTVINYFWPGCLMWNDTQIEAGLINFSPINELRADTGGGTYKIIEKYGMEKCIFFDEVGCENPHFANTPLYYFYMMIYRNTFIHFINASNWNPTENNESRLNSLIDITNNKIQENNERNSL